MARFLTVAAAQFESASGDIATNTRAHLRLIDRGRASGADLLVFPELSLVGHDGAHDLLDVAMLSDDDRLLALSRAAGNMRIVVGFIEEGPAAQFYNAAAVLQDGKLLYLHRKINIPAYGRLIETKFYAQGRFVDIHRLDRDWVAGLLICADLYNPALTHLAFLHGATLLVAPISSGREAVGDEFDNPASWATTLRFYAMMYGAPVIMANRVGREGELNFWGGSRIIDSTGQVLAEAGSSEDVIFARLDYAETRRARAALPTVRDSNLSLVHRETTRLIENLGVPDFVRGRDP
jgi:predicted amidohydrolase